MRAIARTSFLFCILILAIKPQAGLAAPVNGKVFDLRQPDGSVVKTRIWGDEFYQVVESLDGYTLIRDPKTLVICYARLSPDGNELLSSGLSASQPALSKAGLSLHVRISSQARRAQAAAARAAFAEDEKQARAELGAERAIVPPITGVVRGICVMVDFPDEAGTIPASEVNDYCNKIGYSNYGNNGSIRDYFYDVSDGHLTYTNYVPTVYYRTMYNKSYYDDPTKKCGQQGKKIALEVLNWLEGRGFDFSQYDSNGDGVIDAINLYYAGTCSSGWSYGLWAHAGSVTFSADGVSSNRYQLSGMGSALDLGTFCHENGHMLGYWPDLYDTGFESVGIGDYCLMGYGGYGGSAGDRNPIEPCPYMKYIAGWSSTTDLIVPQRELQVPAGANVFFKFPHPTKPNEYYLVSNLLQAGRNIGLSDSGLAIWHIDTLGSNNNEQMTSTSHFLVTLVQADGRWDLEHHNNYSDGNDLYDANSNDICSPSSNPNTNWWDGSVSGLKIHEISASGSVMTFSFGDSADMQVTPAEGFFAFGAWGGPFGPTGATYVLTNHTPAPVTWTASTPADWLDLSATDGVLAPATSGGATASLNANACRLPLGASTSTLTFTDITNGRSVTRHVTVLVSEDVAPPARAIYFFPMCADPGWSRQGQWAFGVPTGQGTAPKDPVSGHTGPNVYGYNLEGDYSNDQPAHYLQTAPLDCSGFQHVSVGFWRWLDVFYSFGDQASLAVSANGVDWSPVWEHYGDPIMDSSWTYVEYDISAMADGHSTVYLRWSIGPTDSVLTFPGWNIDDVALMGDFITTDSTPPAGSLAIQEGAEFTSSIAVILATSAADSESGMSAMRFSNDGAHWSGWESYATASPWALDDGEGRKTVYAQYRDRVGNISAQPSSDTINLDATAPAGSIIINDGDDFTSVSEVLLSVASADAGSSVTAMRFSNNGATWSAWEPFAATKAWTLQSGAAGTRTVHVQFRDGAGNTSRDDISDSIAVAGTPGCEVRRWNLY